MRQTNFKISIFEYKDYRKFLNDWYKAAKLTRASISYRSLAKAAGFKACSFLKLVMEGKRNLTEESLVKLAQALKLNKQELEFFRHLVYLNQAKSLTEQNRHYEQLVQSRKYSQLKPLEKQQFEFYATWYHPIVRELAICKDCDGTAEGIANRIKPSLTVTQVQKSLDLLVTLGFLRKDHSGRWQQTQTILTTGDDVKPIVMQNYHKSILQMTPVLFDESALGEKDISSLTIGVSKSRVAAIKQKIKALRQEILKMVADDVEPDDVLLLNIQLLPVSRQMAGETKKA